MDQANLFEDNIYDALESLVLSLGGPKRVANRLWPDKGIEAGAKDLRNALNPDHRAKLDLFDLIHLMQLGQATGDHIVIERICKDVGYEAPRPVNREEQVEELQKRFNRKVDQLNDIVAELHANGVKLKAVE